MLSDSFLNPNLNKESNFKVAENGIMHVLCYV